MAFVISKKDFRKFIVYFILIFFIPGLFIVIDKQNDLSNTNFTPNNFSFEMNSTNSDYIVKMMEFPPETKFSVIINLNSSDLASITVFGIGEQTYESYIEGFVNLETYPTQKIILQENNPTWFNFTIETEGIVRLLFKSETTNLSINVNGTYYYEVSSYLLRNAIGIFVFLGIYLLLVFSFIPQIFKEIRKRRYKNRMRKKRMEEEKKFYDNYRK